MSERARLLQLRFYSVQPYWYGCRCSTRSNSWDRSAQASVLASDAHCLALKQWLPVAPHKMAFGPTKNVKKKKKKLKIKCQDSHA